MKRVIFLDIDGCLNDHKFNKAAQSSTLDKDKVEVLNKILRATGAVIVLSSAWRYMIIRGAVTLKGFEYLLRTHGVECVDKLIGYTREDAYKFEPRMHQIRDYVRCNGVDKYTIIDDLELGQRTLCKMLRDAAPYIEELL